MPTLAEVWLAEQTAERLPWPHPSVSEEPAGCAEALPRLHNPKSAGLDSLTARFRWVRQPVPVTCRRPPV